jgi:hypothetical protein
MARDAAGEGWSAQPLTSAEQDIVHGARDGRERCACGEVHADGDGVAADTIGRMRAYLAANPGHQFVVDDEAGLIAVVVVPTPGHSGPLQVLGCSGDLVGLLDEIGAAGAEGLS